MVYGIIIFKIDYTENTGNPPPPPKMKQNPTIHPFSRSFCLERGSWIQKYQAERAVALSASELSEVHIRVAWVMGWIFDEYLTTVTHLSGERVCCYSVSLGLSKCLHSFLTSLFPFDSITTDEVSLQGNSRFVCFAWPQRTFAWDPRVCQEDVRRLAKERPQEDTWHGDKRCGMKIRSIQRWGPFLILLSYSQSPDHIK